MNPSYKPRFWILFLLLVLVIISDILIGSVEIPLNDFYLIMTGGESSNPAWVTIIKEFRIPKAITALLAGSGLAVTGLLMQTLFRNPLAGPFVLGISSGASLGVAVLIFAGSLLSTFLIPITLTGSWTVVAAAIAGSTAVLTLILIISLYVRDSMTLLIIGLMVGSLSGALVGVLQYYSEAQEIQSFLLWTFGNLGGVHHQELVVLSITVTLGMAIAWIIAKPLNVLLLGESYASSMGVNIKVIRLIIIIASSVLAGSITAFCGPLAFIGIAIPHLTRITLRTADHRFLIPGCVLMGGIVMGLCDLASQIPGSSRTLPINVVTSMIGAPAVIAILIRSRNLSRSFS